MTTAIDWTKPIETTDGRKARVLASDVRTSDDRSMCVAYENRADSPGDEAIILLARDGRYPMGLRQQFVRNVRVKREGWVNVYRNDTATGTFKSRADADYQNNGSDRRVACIRVEWEE